MRNIIVAGLCLAVAACSRTAAIENHDPKSPEITGLERLGDGPYQPGSTEHFRLIYSVDRAAAVHWSSSAGQLVADGDAVTWTLPDSGEAALTASLETKTRVSTSTFRFRLASSGGTALTAAPTGTVDGTGNATGTSCDLAFDASGNPAMIYRNDTHPAVWYAKWSGSAWQTELVDGMGYEVGGAVDVQMALALAADGTPHVAYTLENGEVHYATKVSSSWTRERVDGTAARYDDPASYVALALDASHSGRPTIFYETATPVVVAAVRTGANAWTDTTLDVGGVASFMGGLAMSGGTAYISVYQGGARVAAWPGSGTSFTVSPVFPINFAYHQPFALALDGSTRPLVLGANTLVHVKPGTGLPDATVTSSPYEESSVSLDDLAFAGGKPYLAINHGSNLELITTDANGYWTYTTAGSIENTAGRIGVAVDPGGNPHACFRRSGVITYQ